MTPERWRQVTEVFHAALAHDAAARARVSRSVPAAVTARLRDEVDAMLAAQADAGQFGESPVNVSSRMGCPGSNPARWSVRTASTG